jgi:hypothetical protein
LASWPAKLRPVLGAGGNASGDNRDQAKPRQYGELAVNCSLAHGGHHLGSDMGYGAIRQIQLVEQEAVDVYALFNSLREGAADAVACLGVGPQKR